MLSAPSHRSIALLVVGLVVLSGCAGLGGTGTETADDTPTPTESPTDTATPSPTPTATATPSPAATPTATPTPTPTPADAGTPTPDDGVDVDWGQVLDAHESSMQELERWRGNLSLTVAGGGQAAQQSGNISFEAARNGDAKFVASSFDSLTSEQYTESAEDPTYARVNQSGDVTYSQSSTDPDFSTFYQPVDAQFLSGLRYADEGTVDTEDGERRRLTVTGVSNVSRSTREDTQGELTEFSLEILLDTDREIITTLAYDVTIERDDDTVTQSVSYGIENVTDATVEAPEWFDEAREETE